MKSWLRYAALGNDWTKPETASRKNATFRTAWHATERDLGQEADRLGVPGDEPLTISVDVAESDLRVDRKGILAHVNVRSPRVIVWLPNTEHGDMSFQLDAFTHWRDNVRACALGLRDLRRLDRYGMADTGQQYRGFAALPSAGASTDVAATVIAEAAHIPLDEVYADPKAAVRQAQVRTHPDRGGDPDAFQRVTEMAEVLLR